MSNFDPDRRFMQKSPQNIPKTTLKRSKNDPKNVPKTTQKQCKTYVLSRLFLIVFSIFFRIKILLSISKRKQFWNLGSFIIFFKRPETIVFKQKIFFFILDIVLFCNRIQEPKIYCWLSGRPKYFSFKIYSKTWWKIEAQEKKHWKTRV